MVERVQVPCKACLGRGHMGTGRDEKVCSGCHGSGFHILQVSFVPCTECNGTGRNKIWSCSTCRGRGIVSLSGY